MEVGGLVGQRKGVEFYSKCLKKTLKGIRQRKNSGF